MRDVSKPLVQERPRLNEKRDRLEAQQDMARNESGTEDGCKTSLTRHNNIDEDTPAALTCVSTPPAIVPCSPRNTG